MTKLSQGHASPGFNYSTETNYLIAPSDRATNNLRFIEVDGEHLDAVELYNPTVKEFEHVRVKSN